MIPTIEDIVAGLVAGKIDARLALAWLNQHVKSASESSLSARDGALEEAARVCLSEADRAQTNQWAHGGGYGVPETFRLAAKAIRALRSPEHAAPQSAAPDRSPDSGADGMPEEPPLIRALRHAHPKNRYGPLSQYDANEILQYVDAIRQWALRRPAPLCCYSPLNGKELRMTDKCVNCQSGRDKLKAMLAAAPNEERG